MTSEALTTLSPSRLETWRLCRYKWFETYVRGNRGPKSPAAAFGSAMDDTLNLAYGVKIVGGRIPDTALPDIFRHHYRMRAGEVGEWHDVSKPEQESLGAAMAGRWGETINQGAPISVQHGFRIPMESTAGKFIFNGFLDLVLKTASGRPVIVDNKTSKGRLKSESVAYKYTNQARAYALAAEIEGFADPDIVLFHVGVKTKQPYVQSDGLYVETPAPARLEFRQFLENQHGYIGEAFDEGDFGATGRGKQLCKRRFCSHWQECQSRFGGEVPE